MRLQILQHVAYEGLGNIQKWIDQHKIEVEWTRLYKNEALPNLANIDGLIILGGTMSVNDTARYPWITEEKQFIAQALSQQKKVLGICLGAQLMASALGQKVYPASSKEIGWWAIDILPNTYLQDLPQNMAFHWHGETFDLPPHAKLIASTKDCKNQIFTIEDYALGMQCHLESNEPAVIEIVNNCGNELVSTKAKPVNFIQTKQALLDDTHKYAAGIEKPMHHLLTRLFL